MQVIVASSDRQAAMRLASLVAREGHTPVIAHRPLDALWRLGASARVLLIDEAPREWAGLELAEAARLVEPDVPIVLVSEGRDPERDARAARLGLRVVDRRTDGLRLALRALGPREAVRERSYRDLAGTATSAPLDRGEFVAGVPFGVVTAAPQRSADPARSGMSH